LKVETVTQIHTSYARLGAYERVCVERWRALNPEVCYQFLTDGDIDPWVEERWPQHAETYRSMYPICRAGVQRLASVLRWGGLYIDCGTYPVKRIADFLPEGIWDRDLAMFNLKSRINYYPLVTDCMFAAIEGHPFIAGLIEEIFRRTECPSFRANRTDADGEFNYRGYVFDTASVHAYSQYALQQDVKGVNGLPDADIIDLHGKPESLNTFRYSTECWLEDNRFVRDGINKHEQEMQTLEILKDTYGI